MSTRHMFTTTVISAFPAMGKTYLASKFPGIVVDLESSDFHWLKNEAGTEFVLDENGKKIANPEWPKNYIEMIKTLDSYKAYRAVFVSSHELVRNEMAKAGIKYTNLAPESTDAMRQKICSRCIERHSPARFVQDLNDNFHTYVKSMIDDTNAVNVITLNEKSLMSWGIFLMMN